MCSEFSLFCIATITWVIQAGNPCVLKTEPFILYLLWVTVLYSSFCKVSYSLQHLYSSQLFIQSFISLKTEGVGQWTDTRIHGRTLKIPSCMWNTNFRICTLLCTDVLHYLTHWPCYPWGSLYICEYILHASEFVHYKIWRLYQFIE